MGEAKRKKIFALKPVSLAVAGASNCVETPGGKLQVRWNDRASVTPFGQMAFFIGFLNLTGVLESWIEDCPLTYRSPNAPTKRDLLGTWLLSILSAGHRCYAHVTSIRGDSELDRATAAIQQARLAIRVLDEHVESINCQVSVATMHLAKGLEFRAVAMMACDDEIIPSQERIANVADDADLEEVYSTERHLFYVACTRARDHLLVTSGDIPSEFIDDLRV